MPQVDFVKWKYIAIIKLGFVRKTQYYSYIFLVTHGEKCAIV